MQTAAYYFPNYHLDKRNEEFHGKGWTEWELMKCARPRFEGHRQPRIPLWGYQDEADPKVMAQKIEAASAHGINAFVFDWYWYDGPYLQRALDEGFLQAPRKRSPIRLLPTSRIPQPENPETIRRRRPACSDRRPMPECPISTI